MTMGQKMNDNSQSRLTYVTQLFSNEEKIPSLRGVSAQWLGDTINLSFFFDGEISEEARDDAGVIAAAIVAQFSEGITDEHFISLGPNEALPNDPFLAYKRD